MSSRWPEEPTPFQGEDFFGLNLLKKGFNKLFGENAVEALKTEAFGPTGQELGPYMGPQGQPASTAPQVAWGGGIPGEEDRTARWQALQTPEFEKLPLPQKFIQFQQFARNSQTFNEMTREEQDELRNRTLGVNSTLEVFQNKDFGRLPEPDQNQAFDSVFGGTQTWKELNPQERDEMRRMWVPAYAQGKKQLEQEESLIQAMELSQGEVPPVMQPMKEAQEARQRRGPSIPYDQMAYYAAAGRSIDEEFNLHIPRPGKEDMIAPAVLFFLPGADVKTQIEVAKSAVKEINDPDVSRWYNKFVLPQYDLLRNVNPNAWDEDSLTLSNRLDMAFTQGVMDVAASGVALYGLAQQARGMEKGAEESVQLALKLQGIMGEGGYKPRSWTEYGPGEVGGWSAAILEGVVRNIPNLLTAYAGGAAVRGAIGGAELVTGPAAKTALGRITNATTKLAQNSKFINYPGAVGAGMGLEIPSIYMDIYAQTGKLDPKKAIAYGTVAGVMEGIGAGTMMTSLMKAGVKSETIGRALAKTASTWERIGTRLGGEVTKNTVTEGITEGLQTWTENLAVEMAKDPDLNLTPQTAMEVLARTWEQVADATVIGAASGFGGGVVSEGITTADLTMHPEKTMLKPAWWAPGVAEQAAAMQMAQGAGPPMMVRGAPTRQAAPTVRGQMIIEPEGGGPEMRIGGEQPLTAPQILGTIPPEGTGEALLRQTQEEMQRAEAARQTQERLAAFEARQDQDTVARLRQRMKALNPDAQEVVHRRTREIMREKRAGFVERYGRERLTQDVKDNIARLARAQAIAEVEANPPPSRVLDATGRPYRAAPPPAPEIVRPGVDLEDRRAVLAAQERMAAARRGAAAQQIIEDYQATRAFPRVTVVGDTRRPEASQVADEILSKLGSDTTLQVGISDLQILQDRYAQALADYVALNTERTNRVRSNQDELDRLIDQIGRTQPGSKRNADLQRQIDDLQEYDLIEGLQPSDQELAAQERLQLIEDAHARIMDRITPDMTPHLQSTLNTIAQGALRWASHVYRAAGWDLSANAAAQMADNPDVAGSFSDQSINDIVAQAHELAVETLRITTNPRKLKNSEWRTLAQEAKTVPEARSLRREYMAAPKRGAQGRYQQDILNLFDERILELQRQAMEEPEEETVAEVEEAPEEAAAAVGEVVQPEQGTQAAEGVTPPPTTPKKPRVRKPKPVTPAPVTPEPVTPEPTTPEPVTPTVPDEQAKINDWLGRIRKAHWQTFPDLEDEVNAAWANQDLPAEIEDALEQKRAAVAKLKADYEATRTGERRPTTNAEVVAIDREIAALREDARLDADTAYYQRFKTRYSAAATQSQKEAYSRFLTAAQDKRQKTMDLLMSRRAKAAAAGVTTPAPPPPSAPAAPAAPVAGPVEPPKGKAARRTVERLEAARTEDEATGIYSVYLSQVKLGNREAVVEQTYRNVSNRLKYEAKYGKVVKETPYFTEFMDFIREHVPWKHKTKPDAIPGTVPPSEEFLKTRVAELNKQLDVMMEEIKAQLAAQLESGLLTPEQEAAARAAFDDMTSQLWARYRELKAERAKAGHLISDAVVEDGGASLIGKVLPADPTERYLQLAEIAQVLRDYRWEVFRLVYVDDAGRILDTEALSFRLVGSAPVFPWIHGQKLDRIVKSTGLSEEAAQTKAEYKYASEVKRKAKRIGATGIYMLHNHPTSEVVGGQNLFSKDDISSTIMAHQQHYGDLLKGALVIDDRIGQWIPADLWREVGLPQGFKKRDITEDQWRRLRMRARLYDIRSRTQRVEPRAREFPKYGLALEGKTVKPAIEYSGAPALSTQEDRDLRAQQIAEVISDLQQVSMDDQTYWVVYATVGRQPDGNLGWQTLHAVPVPRSEVSADVDSSGNPRWHQLADRIIGQKRGMGARGAILIGGKYSTPGDLAANMATEGALHELLRLGIVTDFYFLEGDMDPIKMFHGTVSMESLVGATARQVTEPGVEETERFGIPKEDTYVTSEAGSFGPRLSLDIIDAWEQDYREAGAEHGFSQEEIDESVSNLRFAANIMLIKPQLLPIHDPTAVGGKDLGPIRANEEYNFSFDLDTNCPKNMQFDRYVQAVGEQRGQALSGDEVQLLVQFMEENGLKAPCGYCYVHQARAAAQQQRVRYLRALDDIQTFAESTQAAPAVIARKVWGPAMSNLQKRLAIQWVKDVRAGKAKINADPRLLVDEEFADEQRKADPRLDEFLNETERSAQGAGKPKPRQAYFRYTGQLLRMPQDTVDKLNARAGLRMFSSTDFKMDHVIDLMEGITDAAIRKLMAHAFTKVLEFPKIFGGTGIKINMSLSVKTVDGEMVEDSVGGLPWEEAKVLRERYPDVGTIMVIHNEAELQWALDQPWVDMIIPWHRSHQPKWVTPKGWRDFTMDQHDKGNGLGRNYQYSEHRNDLDRLKRAAKRDGAILRFHNVILPNGQRATEHPGYFKLVTDIARWDTPQRAVTPDFDFDAMEEAARRWQEEPVPPLDQKLIDRFINEQLPRLQELMAKGEAQAVQQGRKSARYRRQSLAQKTFVETPPGEQRNDRWTAPMIVHQGLAEATVRKAARITGPDGSVVFKADPGIDLTGMIKANFKTIRMTKSGWVASEPKARQTRTAPLVVREEGERFGGGEERLEAIDRYPRAHCYRNAWKYAAENEVTGDTLVVHGMVTNGEGRRFGHAWVEQGDNVTDPTANVTMPKDQYYQAMEVSVQAKYTPEQAMINAIRSGNSGPWVADEVGDRYVERRPEPVVGKPTPRAEEIFDLIYNSGTVDAIHNLYWPDPLDAIAGEFNLDTVKNEDIEGARQLVKEHSQERLRRDGHTGQITVYRGGKFAALTGRDASGDTTVSVTLRPSTARHHAGYKAKASGAEVAPIEEFTVNVDDVLGYSGAFPGTFAEEEIIVRHKDLRAKTAAGPMAVREDEEGFGRRPPKKVYPGTSPIVPRTGPLPTAPATAAPAPPATPPRRGVADLPPLKKLGADRTVLNRVLPDWAHTGPPGWVNPARTRFGETVRHYFNLYGQDVPKRISRILERRMMMQDRSKLLTRWVEAEMHNMIVDLERKGFPEPNVRAAIKLVTEGAMPLDEFAQRLDLPMDHQLVKFLADLHETHLAWQELLAQHPGMSQELRDVILESEYYQTRMYQFWLLGDFFVPQRAEFDTAVTFLRDELAKEIEAVMKRAGELRGKKQPIDVAGFLQTGDMGLISGASQSRQDDLVSLRNHYLQLARMIDDIEEQPDGSYNAIKNMAKLQEIALGQINFYLHQQASPPAKAAGMQISNFLQRRLTEVFRQLYGEIKDPVVREAITVGVQTNLLADYMAMDALFEEGKDAGWWSEDETEVYRYRLGDPNNPQDKLRYGAMTGKFVPKGLWDALHPEAFNLEWASSPVGWAVRAWWTYLATMRALQLWWFKTVDRNFVTGLTGFALQDGDALYPGFWKHLTKGVKIAWKAGPLMNVGPELTIHGGLRRGKKNPAAIKTVADAAERGYYTHSMNTMTHMLQTVLKRPWFTPAGVSKRARQGLTTGMEHYSLIDFPSKHAAYWSFLERHQEAWEKYYNKMLSEGKKAEAQRAKEYLASGALERAAAEHVQNNFQNRYRIPKIIDSVTATGFADYAAYPWDSVRTTGNALKWALKLAFEGDPYMPPDGKDIRPLLGWFASKILMLGPLGGGNWLLGMAFGRTPTSLAWAGILEGSEFIGKGAAAMLEYLLPEGDDDDEREKKKVGIKLYELPEYRSIRNFLPRYDRDSALIGWTVYYDDGTTRDRYAVISGNTAWAVEELLVGALQRKMEGDSFWKSLGVSVARQFGPGMAIESTWEFLTGQNLALNIKRPGFVDIATAHFSGHPMEEEAELLKERLATFLVDSYTGQGGKTVDYFLDYKKNKELGRHPTPGSYLKAENAHDVVSKVIRMIRVYGVDKEEATNRLNYTLRPVVGAIAENKAMIGTELREASKRAAPLPEDIERSIRGRARMGINMQEAHRLIKEFQTIPIGKTFSDQELAVITYDAGKAAGWGDISKEQAMAIVTGNFEALTPYVPEISPTAMAKGEDFIYEFIDQNYGNMKGKWKELHQQALEKGLQVPEDPAKFHKFAMEKYEQWKELHKKFRKQ